MDGIFGSRAIFAWAAIAVFLCGQGASAAETAESRRGAENKTNKAQGQSSEEEHFYTGLDFSFLAGKDEHLRGPGMTWGLILVPKKLELEMGVHSMLGNKIYQVPMDLTFKVPFEAGRWLVPYVAAGPVLIIEKEEGRTSHDFAAAVAVGIALKTPQPNWRIFVEGGYNYRFWRQHAHVGCGAIGFVYRF